MGLAWYWCQKSIDEYNAIRFGADPALLRRVNASSFSSGASRWRSWGFPAGESGAVGLPGSSNRPSSLGRPRRRSRRPLTPSGFQEATGEDAERVAAQAYAVVQMFLRGLLG